MENKYLTKYLRNNNNLATVLFSAICDTMPQITPSDTKTNRIIDKRISNNNSLTSL